MTLGGKKAFFEVDLGVVVHGDVASAEIAYLGGIDAHKLYTHASRFVLP